jgi:RHS repeat-associated protein
MPRSPADNPATSNQPRTILLATDNKNSVLAEISRGKPNSIAYSAYGQPSAQQEVATGLGFNGELREARIGWYLLGNGYRAYNPVLMRFHSPDSWSPFGAGGWNAYMYCGGEPVMGSDSTGHFNPSKLWGNITSFFTNGVRNRPALTLPRRSSSTVELIPNHSQRSVSTPSIPEYLQPPPPSYSEAMKSLPPRYDEVMQIPLSQRLNGSDRFPARSLSHQGAAGVGSTTSPASTSLSGPPVNRATKPVVNAEWPVTIDRRGAQRVRLNGAPPSRPSERVLPNGVVIGRDGVERVTLENLRRIRGGESMGAT